ncbi:MAG: hypothetical protein FWE37_03980 [Spirochaetaceae bacterium]|nr:hypothetical protein [Spirochaetaceae bacterium]
MNQNDVKQALLSLESNVPEFSVIFSGKTSQKVNGLYKPETMEILIHNLNFKDDNSLLYTAIHEYAHHVHFNSPNYERPSAKRAHTIAYRTILHGLLNKAEEIKLYKNIFDSEHEFVELTKKIKEQYLAKNGNLMKDFGRLLIEALDLCQRHQTSFEDYVERVLTMQRGQAKSIMKVFALDIDPKIGFDNMKIASGLKDPEQRQFVEEMLQEGKSQDEARSFIREHKVKPEENLKRLEAEKRRIEKSLEKLTERLGEVEAKLNELAHE